MRKATLNQVLLGSVLLSAIAVGAVAAPPTPRSAVTPKAEVILASVDAPLSSVVVMGKRPRRAHDEVLQLDTTRASSCAFMGGDSFNSLYYDGLRYLGVRDASVGYYFSETSPLGDASRFSRNGFGQGRNFYLADGCRASDYNFAAARARILRRDKTLPEAYALYDAGQYADAIAMFEKSFHKLPGSVSDEAAMMIGRIYIERSADPADAAKAMPWLQRAAGGRYSYRVFFNPQQPYDAFPPQAEAAAMLGKIHLVGYGAPRDPATAAKWFKRAFAHGHVPAGKILGDIYARGYGVPQDTTRAVSYYSQAAKRGFGSAQYALGQAYYYGETGVSQDIRKALGWYQQAAKVNQADALFALAYAYDAGEGVPRDGEKAIGLYKTAALQGSREAQGALGTYFYKGEIVPGDRVIARKWFEAAAAQGDVDAIFNLAAMMSRGEGGERDLVKAMAWMNIAKAGGHVGADRALASLEGRMTVADRRAASDLVRPRSND